MYCQKVILIVYIFIFGTILQFRLITPIHAMDHKFSGSILKKSIILNDLSANIPPPCEIVVTHLTKAVCGQYVFNNKICTSSGLYYDTLVKFDGCDSIIVLDLIIYPTPRADFSVNDPSQCFAEQNFIFTDQSSVSYGLITETVWIFEKDTVYNAKIYSPARLNPGIYKITLKVKSDHQCTDEYIRSFSVKQSPDAEFLINDTIQCEKGNNFVFVAVNDSLRYYWSFGDGNNYATSKKEVKWHYQSEGEKVVMLIAINDSGCSDIKSKLVHVLPSPVAKFKITSDTAQCLTGNFFTFSNDTKISNGNIFYIWDWGDNTTCPDPIPTHSYSYNSEFNIKLITYSDKNCYDSFSASVIVFPDPITDFSHSTLCPGKAIFFYSKSTIDTGYSIVSYYWEFGENNSSSTLANPTYLYVAPGTYLVKHISISNKGCYSEKIKAIYIPDKTKSNELTRVTVSGQKVLVEWTAPDSGFVRFYSVKKSVDGVNFSNLVNVGANEFFIFDDAVDVNKLSYYYHVSLTDSCGNHIGPTNIGKTILLTADTSGQFPVLIWTPYLEWKHGVKEYALQVKTLMKKDTAQFDIDDNYQTVVFIPQTSIPTDPTGKIPIKFQDTTFKFESLYSIYRVIAYRNPDGLKSVSNTICIPVQSRIFMPNSFTPDGDGLNDEFKPIGAFIAEYHMVIFNLWGEKIFETSDLQTGWKGTCNNHLCPAGNYYYHIRVKGVDGKTKYFKGLLMLIR